MNILPKKNWHVRKKENIARVRRDEAEAAEKEIERRAKQAEQEARHSFLRQRNRLNNPSQEVKTEDAVKCEDSVPVQPDIYNSSGHINFFNEAERGATSADTNKEYEEEKKKEREDQEKKIGLLTYLGQDTYEATGQKYWYTQLEGIVVNKNADQEQEVGLKTKSKIDPLSDIIKYTGSKPLPFVDKCSHSDSSSKVKKKKHKHKNKLKKHKKEYKHKKRKKKYSSSESGEDLEEQNKRNKLQKLREERLKREAVERRRQERLLAGKDPDGKDETNPNLPYKQKYSSQFNPHLAKQNTQTLEAGTKYWLN